MSDRKITLTDTSDEIPEKIYWMDGKGDEHVFVRKSTLDLLDALNGCSCAGDFELKIRSNDVYTVETPDNDLGGSNSLEVEPMDTLTRLYQLRSELRKTLKPKRSKWHRVEDEMPEPGHTVLIFTADYGIQMTHCYQSETRIYWSGPYHDFVTHWRELPKPPKE